jgi:hypothetical protein
MKLYNVSIVGVKREIVVSTIGTYDEDYVQNLMKLQIAGSAHDAMTNTLEEFRGFYPNTPVSTIIVDEIILNGTEIIETQVI